MPEPTTCGTCRHWKPDYRCTKRGKCYADWDHKYCTRFYGSGGYGGYCSKFERKAEDNHA